MLLRIRKLADRSEGERLTRWDPETGDKYLLNPANGNREGWPLAGIQIEGEVPAVCTVSEGFVQAGKAEGWITTETEHPVVRPAGPTQDQWMSSQTGKPHVFIHIDALVLHTVQGDVRYRVTHQPDKYAADGDDTTPVTPEVYAQGNTRVDHFYALELESAPAATAGGVS